MNDTPELICAYILDGQGRGERVDWAAVQEWTEDQGPIWVHLNIENPGTEEWLRQKSGLNTFIIDGLLAQESRPRCDSYDDGVLMILRGVNLNPGADPEDMVSIRIWVEENRMISTRFRRLMAVEDVRRNLEVGKGPISTGHFIARLAASLTERMGPVIDGLSDQVAELEEKMNQTQDIGPVDLRQVRSTLIDLRHVAISLRRYVNPQREALNRLVQLDEAWNSERVRGRLRETIDRVTRITEDLDEIRERSVVIQDELQSRLSQKMERTMYVLTVVATIMLPLGFLTGLLGINVGGIPGAELGWAFWAVCGIMALVVVAEVWILRWFKWI